VGGDEQDGGCEHVWMMVNDLGMTFGRANLFNRAAPGSVNFEQWSHVPIGLAHHASATSPRRRVAPSRCDHPRNRPQILADLLVQLSDAQLHDLFEAARFPQRKTAVRAATSDQWVEAFKPKSGIRSSTATVTVASLGLRLRATPHAGFSPARRCELRVGAALARRARATSRRDSVAAGAAASAEQQHGAAGAGALAIEVQVAVVGMMTGIAAVRGSPWSCSRSSRPFLAATGCWWRRRQGTRQARGRAARLLPPRSRSSRTT
jgi:hypothetical protein